MIVKTRRSDQTMHVVLCSIMLLTSKVIAGVETLPPLTDGVAPRTFGEMWAGFDPRKEPLDVEVLKEWEEDGVVLKVLRYRIGIFKGRKAMMAAAYGHPKGGEDLPGLVQIHGGGQYAHWNAVLTNAKRGYATISVAWAGRIDAPGYRVGPHGVKLFWDGKTNDPDYKLTTDWGALDGYHAPSRNPKNVFPSAKAAAWTLDTVESPRNSSWFLCALGARRALTFLEQQLEVDKDRLGVYGHSMGGKAARFKDEDLADTVVAKSIEFMERHKDGPLFLYVGMFEPHVPRTPHARFAGGGDCGVRGDVIRQIDDSAGRILAALDRLKIADNTLVIFSSDNGPVLFDGYYGRSVEDAGGHRPAGGLRGWKYLAFEGGTRVPFIVRWPGRVPVGVTDQMVCLTDLLATCVALTGSKLPQGAGVDSLDVLPILLGQTKKQVRDSVVRQGVSGAFAIRRGDWKFIPANAGALPGGIGSGADPNDTRFKEAIITEPLLFHLKTDPGETHNLAQKEPAKVKELADLLMEIRRERRGTGEDIR